MLKLFSHLLTVFLLLVLGGCGSGSDRTSTNAAATIRNDSPGWIGAWGAAPYGPYPAGPLGDIVPIALPGNIPLPPIPTLFSNNHALDQSFRMIVHPTIGGTSVRIRLSNLMGDRPVVFSPVRVAKAAAVAPAIIPGSDTAVLFNGKPEVTVAPGAEAVSDPVSFTFAPGDDLAISFHVVGESGAITWHAVAFSPNYVSLPMASDTTSDPSGATFTQPTLGWFFVSGVDVLRPDSAGTLVAIGDSITDGAFTLGNTRWTDWFAQMLQGQDLALGILNEGINSNTVTRQGTSKTSLNQGPPAVERFTRDVLQRPGVSAVLIFEGTNDLSGGIPATEVFADIRTLVKRAQAAGLCVVVGTIMPREDTPAAPWDAANHEPERQRLNEMLRAQSDIDGIADFDKAMASPIDPMKPNPAFYFPDLLHPNSLGTYIMATAVPIEALLPPPSGRCSKASR